MKTDKVLHHKRMCCVDGPERRMHHKPWDNTYHCIMVHVKLINSDLNTKCTSKHWDIIGLLWRQIVWSSPISWETRKTTSWILTCYHPFKAICSLVYRHSQAIKPPEGINTNWPSWITSEVRWNHLMSDLTCQPSWSLLNHIIYQFSIPDAITKDNSKFRSMVWASFTLSIIRTE